MAAFSRRWFLCCGAAFASSPAQPAGTKNETVYHFGAGDYDVRMSVEFYDRYSSNGFWFDDRRTSRHYCLSANGEKDRSCLASFFGSIAVARYRIRSLSKSPNALTLRERVRVIDQDSRLRDRPPFERTLEIQGGVASDIQAFGYETSSSSPALTHTANSNEPWCFMRQDLYFAAPGPPFLVIHWKHTLSAIRLVDVIPGEETQFIIQ